MVQGATEGGRHVVPTLFIKSVRYDSTPAKKLRVMTQSTSASTGDTFMDPDTINDAKLVVFESKSRLILKETSSTGQTRFIHFWSHWPCLLRVQQRGRGEDYAATRSGVAMGCEKDLREEKVREVVGVITDADIALDRTETIESGQAGNEDVVKVRIKCQVHKKYAIVRHTLPRFAKLDSSGRVVERVCPSCCRLTPNCEA